MIPFTLYIHIYIPCLLSRFPVLCKWNAFAARDEGITEDSQRLYHEILPKF